MKQTLLDITEDMAAIDELLAESGGEITPETEGTLDAWFAELDTNLTGKVDNYCALITEIECRAAVRKAEADRLYDRAKIDENAAKALRERLRFVWELRSMGKLQTSRYTVSLAKNGGKAPLDVRVGAEELPAWAVKTETVVTVDKDAIRSRLDAGEQLDFASLMQRGNRISIK
jgi:hypothetical protein